MLGHFKITPPYSEFHYTVHHLHESDSSHLWSHLWILCKMAEKHKTTALTEKQELKLI